VKIDKVMNGKYRWSFLTHSVYTINRGDTVRLHVYVQLQWRFGAVGSDVGQINEVTLRQPRLVLGWMTVSGINWRGKFISV